MTPLLYDGDYLVVRKVLNNGKVQVGNIVAVKHPHFGPIVKAVVGVTGDSIKLKGLSKLSVCPNGLGDFKKADIDGVGVAVIPIQSRRNSKHNWVKRLDVEVIQALMA